MSGLNIAATRKRNTRTCGTLKRPPELCYGDVPTRHSINTADAACDEAMRCHITATFIGDDVAIQPGRVAATYIRDVAAMFHFNYDGTMFNFVKINFFFRCGVVFRIYV